MKMHYYTENADTTDCGIAVFNYNSEHETADGLVGGHSSVIAATMKEDRVSCKSCTDYYFRNAQHREPYKPTPLSP